MQTFPAAWEMVIFTFFGKIFTFIYRKDTVIELTYGTIARRVLC
ncbi:hypothetical protein COO91_05455 [Nostoc flagelliforme CCNUN1]|uniref:Uncharacterized protein n=1 Tax=Nostoc flagelliforme CCNUN1 TaxID=2038116 RepID=A0A2K8SVG3_9NOSO|nr:hypothetical protein COO91_05455 [Nostoc flagelliforme CCNUN1]